MINSTYILWLKNELRINFWSLFSLQAFTGKTIFFNSFKNELSFLF